jgi:eukaryotic-like serine/threonine-protein kinase
VTTLIASQRRRELLGTGVFATVYAEWDHLLDRTVAVKELNSPFAHSEAFVRAFLARAQSLFDLDHEHVLAIHRADAGRESPAVVRELAEETLEASLLAGPLLPERVEEILSHALFGLQALHERGIVHGAVKPANLFRCGDRYKIGDFGMAVAPGTAAPVRRYLAPELLRGEVAAPASDLYSLGVVAYELLLGQHGFERLVVEQGSRDLPPLHELLIGFPRPVSEMVQQMLRKAAADRPATAREALALLDAPRAPTVRLSPRALDESAFDLRLRPPAAKPALTAQKVKRAGAIAVATCLAVLVVAAILFLRAQRPAERQPALPPVATAPAAASAGVATAPPAAPSPSVASAAPSPAAAPPVEASPKPAPVAAAVPQGPTPPGQTKTRPGKTPATPVDAGGVRKTRDQESHAVGEEAETERSAAPVAQESNPAATMPKGREIIHELQPERYELSSLHGGQRAYVDVVAVYADVTEHEDRIPCIETANGDRAAGAGVSFTLSRAANVYVGYDRDGAQKPKWLQAFTRTGATWSVLLRDQAGALSGMIHFDVFTRSYPAGPVTLGPNVEKVSGLRRLFGRSEPNMYVVCVDPR